MMMGQSRASNGTLPRILFALLAFALVVFFGTPLKTMTREFFANVIFPHSAESAYAGLSKAELIDRLSTAEHELESVRYQSVLYALLADENTKLKSTASVQSFSKAVPARVLSRPPQTHYDTLLLDKGNDAGIQENDIVAIQGVALGKIVSVGGSSSTAELFSTAGVTHDAILGTPRAVAVAVGLGGGSFSISLPRSVTVDVGEAVRIPNSETLVLGTVVSVQGAGTDASQEAYIASPVSMQSLDYVSVIPQGR